MVDGWGWNEILRGGMEGWEVGAVGAEERKRVLAVGGQGPVGGWQRAVVWLAGLPDMPRCWTREGIRRICGG